MVMMMMADTMPFLVLFFAMAMGVNHRQEKNDQTPDHKNDNNRLILPDLAYKCGHVGIHAVRTYTISAENENDSQNK